jgi:hypothetical protein
MDFSQMIQGTRQFFQGHPGKPRDDIANSEPHLIETKCGLKKNEPYTYNPTSYSDVIKLNYPPVQSSHGTSSVPRYYSRPFCEQITYQQKVPSAYQVNESCARDSDPRSASYAKPNNSQIITHKPAIQYEEQNVWENNGYSKVCDPSSKIPLNQVPTFSMATNLNTNFDTSVTYQAQQQQQVPYRTNEYFVPAPTYLHQDYASKAADFSQYSDIVVRQPFIQSTAIVPHGQDCNSTNVYQEQRSSSLPYPENAVTMNFRDQDRQQTFSKSFDAAPSLLRQTENSSVVVSREYVLNQQYTLPVSRTNQQHILPHGQQQWDSKIQCASVGHHVIRQNKECVRSACPQEQHNVFENREITRPHQNPQQNYHSQELSKTTSKNCAFIPFYASAETETAFRPSTNSQADQTTFVTGSSSVKTQSNIGSGFAGVSVIQHSMNNKAISVGFIKKNEERKSVISYTNQRDLGGERSTTVHVSSTKCSQFETVPIHAIVPQPKKQLTPLGCDSLRPDIPSNSTKLLNPVNAAVAAKTVNSSPLDVKQSPSKAMKPPKLKVKSFGNSVKLIPPSNAVSVDTALIQSDPIVSDEKWEEWKSSFDTEWTAFVEDLANSRNIKIIHRYAFFFY